MNQVATQKESRAVREQKQSTEERFVVPDVDIFETKEAYVLIAEMPGVPKDGLEIVLESGNLTLVGRRSDEVPKGNVVYRESRPAGFRRVFELDPGIDAGKISAKMDQGVLTLELPKAERVKPRKISVE